MYNLLFVAHGSEIWVEEPSFPTQQLPDEPKLIMTNQPSEPYLRGYIDPRHPHSINNLLVCHLGSEEIIVAARDDGDVDAYFTRHVFAATQASKGPDAQTRVDLRPLLQRNVGNSAWGIAVHTEARKIAVSSNNHEFNIFSFALVNDDTRDFGKERNQDLHITIENGNANIPCISFCNTGDDPDGRWLLAADIEGRLNSWDLSESSMVNTARFRFNECRADTTNFGWIAAFMDPRMFSHVNKFNVAMPSFVGDWMSALDRQLFMWDMRSEKFNLVRRQLTALANAGDDPDLLHDRLGMDTGMETLCSFDPRALFSETNQDRCPRHKTQEECLLIWIGMVRRWELSFHVVDWQGHSNIPWLSKEYHDIELSVHENEESHDAGLLTSSEPIEAPELEEDDYDSDTVSSPEEDTNHHRSKLEVFAGYDKSMCPNLPCPIFYGAKDHMFLLQPSTGHGTSDDHFPIMMLGDHWDAYTPAELAPVDRRQSDFRIFFHDPEDLARGSLTAQIPALGVLLVGNQSGRVTVYSGFRTRTTVDLRFDRKPNGQGKEHKWVHGLRLEAMLPYAAQEAAGLRPRCMLYGMAVAPMQGSSDLPDDQKRWRLIMMYIDRTVMSYEIKRRAEDGNLSVSDLMV